MQENEFCRTETGVRAARWGYERMRAGREHIGSGTRFGKRCRFEPFRHFVCPDGKIHISTGFTTVITANASRGAYRSIRRGCSKRGHRTYKRICGLNAGSWPCKEELPQAILEDEENQKFFLFQIESCGGWYWEIAENNSGKLYLTLSGGIFRSQTGKNGSHPEKKYSSRKVSFCVGESLNDVLQKMTLYRRDTAKFSAADSGLPVIFNEYMYFSWDSPDEEKTRALVPVAAACGADVYVIDCGWHDESGRYKDLSVCG